MQQNTVSMLVSILVNICLAQCLACFGAGYLTLVLHGNSQPTPCDEGPFGFSHQKPSYLTE